MNNFFDKKRALADWVKVRSLSDVYNWHIVHTPWLGKKVIEETMKVYIEDMMKLEEGTLDPKRVFEISDYQRKILENEII